MRHKGIEYYKLSRKSYYYSRGRRLKIGKTNKKDVRERDFMI